MQRTPVTSSNIVSIGHDPATNTLEVEFKGGGVYSYAGVDAAKHAALIAADSVGSHFHKHIKNDHSFSKAAPPE